MEHNFHGPSYTIGIEEELMIVDAESYALVNAIESLLADAPDGEIKPELHESVLEISTSPARPNSASARPYRSSESRCSRIIVLITSMISASRFSRPSVGR